MSCCGKELTQEEHDELFVGKCGECGNDIGEEGHSIARDNCCYSPVECEKCGYHPCALFC
jgi:hypothetical protein